MPELRERPSSLSFDEGELEHGWAGELELDDERPSTALTSDPRDRKWMLAGLGATTVLGVGLVAFAMHAQRGAETVSGLGIGPVIELVDLGIPDMPEVLAVAPEPEVAPLRKRDLRSSAKTLAATTVIPPRKAPPVPDLPERSPAPVVAPRSTPAPAVAAAPPASAILPTPVPAPQPVLPPSPDEPAGEGSVDLPDVAGWDADDDDALRESDPVERG